MSESDKSTYEVALRDFKRARKQAALQHLMAQLTGKSDELLAYDMVRRQLRAAGTIDRGLQEIPLDAIVGSVGRYDDFTRDFLPKKDSIQERWARVKAAILNMTGMMPISVYQIGEVYFVQDGNNRVSVAKQLGTPTISAQVIEVKTKVPLHIDDDPDEVQCKARYAAFLEKTGLDECRPDAYLLMTFCEHFNVLLSQIDSYHQKLTAEVGSISYKKAAARWYDNFYQPVVEIIREQGVMHYFPQRTEADLYLLFVEHQEELLRALGWHIDTDDTVANLVEQKAQAPRSIISWVGLQLYKLLIPDELDPGPEPGQWRKKRVARRRYDSLFANILVGIQGEGTNWETLEHAIRIAKREDGSIYGLHVESGESDPGATESIRAEFEQRCEANELRGEFTVEIGNPARKILERAAWADLVAVSLSQSEEAEPAKRFGTGFKLLIQRCPRPMLIVPEGVSSPMDRALLAYDGSPKANEALFVAAYLASRWATQLTVVTVETNFTPQSALDRARAYLDKQGVQNVNYLLRPGPIGDSLLEVAALHDINLLIMGGFGIRPVLNLVLGSTVDHMLREFRQPILVCR